MLGVVCALLSLLVALVIYAGSAEAPLASGFPWQFRLAAKLRTPILVFIVVPLSFLMRWYRWVTRQVRRLREGAGDARTAARHATHVEDIVRQIKQWNSAGRPQLLRTAKPNWAAMSTKLGSNKSTCSLIKVAHMRDVLHIDREALTARVEPGATMGQLSEELLPLGLMLQTHIEMESISVGGCVMGFGIETNSHRYGFFQESVRELEFVDASGTLRSVTAESDPELFYALPWSHGSVGFLTAVTLQLIQCQPYVRMEYEPTSTAEELTRRLRELAESGPSAPDFLEATLYSADHAVIQAGYFEATPSAKLNPINRWYKPFFFRHVETALRVGAFEESLPLAHFLHRFSRSIFWEIEDMIPFSSHPVYRCLWGWLGAPEVSLLKLFQGPVIRRASVQAHVVQESIMPLDKLPEGISKFDGWFGNYPLLVFPVRIFDRGPLSGFIHPTEAGLDPLPTRTSSTAELPHLPVRSGLWVDLGAYGVPRAVRQGQMWDAKRNVRAMEHWTRQVGGWQVLYTDVFATPRELRLMFDFSLLDRARERLGALDAFPDVYAKIRPEAGIVNLEAELAAERKGLD